jgi:hypothetical protein
VVSEVLVLSAVPPVPELELGGRSEADIEWEPERRDQLQQRQGTAVWESPWSEFVAPATPEWRRREWLEYPEVKRNEDR